MNIGHFRSHHDPTADARPLRGPASDLPANDRRARPRIIHRLRGAQERPAGPKRRALSRGARSVALTALAALVSGALTGLVVAALASVAACAPRPETGRLPAWKGSGPPPFFGAVALGLFGHPNDPRTAGSDIEAIAALDASGIVLPLFWRSADVTSTTIEPFAYGVPQEAYDRSTIEIARLAHARGLAFEVLPIIQLDKLAVDEWRGTLRPADWQAWWRSYRSFILHHAKVAEEASAEIFSVGSELGTTEHDREAWARLIEDVRGVFHGRLVYSANWDHYESVTFWDLLDGIGLSSYYELADRPDASQEDLNAAWRRHRDRILAWARPHGKPVHLTEVGYPARRGAAVHPWDYTLDEPVDVEAQAKCFRAFVDAWKNVPELGGTTIWIWDHGKAGLLDPSYSIAGKPAAAVVRQLFQARATPGRSRR